MVYDEEAIKKKLKMEIGCSDVSDMDLWKHKVIFNSPVKGDDGMSMNAAEYVAKGLEEWKSSITELKNELVKEEPEQEKFKVGEIKQLEVPDSTPQTNFKAFDVGYNLDHFVVAFNMDKPESKYEIEILQANFTFIKERDTKDITQFDRVISYYQWHTWMSRLDRPVSTGVFDMEDVDKKLMFTFQGLEDEGLEQAQKFM
jgi:hypothetical protein